MTEPRGGPGGPERRGAAAMVSAEAPMSRDEAERNDFFRLHIMGDDGGPDMEVRPPPPSEGRTGNAWIDPHSGGLY